MKRILLSVVALLAFATSASAAENVGFYVAPKLLYSYQKVGSMKNGGTVDIYQNGNYMGSDSYSASGGSESDSTWGGALAIGFDFHPLYDLPLRVELEYAARSDFEHSWSDYGDTDFHSKLSYGVQTLFTNLYLDWHTGTRFTPYIGVGVGFAFIDGDFSGSEKNDRSGSIYDYRFGGSDSTTNFAWNIGLGTAVSVTDNLAVDLGYRYVDFGKADVGYSATIYDQDNISSYHERSKMKGDLTGHELMLGVRWTFW